MYRRPADGRAGDPLDLLALRYQEERAQGAFGMRRGEWIPRLNAFGSTQWDDPDVFGTSKNHWTMGFGARVEHFRWSRPVGRRSQAAPRPPRPSIQYKEAQARRVWRFGAPTALSRRRGSAWVLRKRRWAVEGEPADRRGALSTGSRKSIGAHRQGIREHKRRASAEEGDVRFQDRAEPSSVLSGFRT